MDNIKINKKDIVNRRKKKINLEINGNNTYNFHEKQKIDLAEKMKINGHKLWAPQLDEFDILNTDSCYSMESRVNDEEIADEEFDESKLEFVENNIAFKNKLIKCKKVLLKPTKRQQKIIHSWFNACTAMYNATIKYIKLIFPFKELQNLRELYEIVFGGSLINIMKSLEKTIKIIKGKMARLLKYLNNDN